MFTVSGCNFHSTNPSEAVDLYHSIFNWKILTNSLNHSELEIFHDPQFILYFDKAKAHCPTYPGALSLKSPDWNKFLVEDSAKNQLWQDNFALEYKDPKDRYHSWLDPWKNRIWIIK